MDDANMYQRMLDDFHVKLGWNFLGQIGRDWLPFDERDKEQLAADHAAFVGRYFKFLGAPQDVNERIERLMRERLLTHADIPF
ncbi:MULTISPECIES: hypothetical protein [unclassified Sinorhizobium]|uniref:hypothetical protein n=1 Tax=unclassified Sinorhizobium TaxID=2613772 RepID=UPI0024C30DD9|nr:MULTISPECIES: hypothetical protein [unclassified Sinorhizobium]MDK1376148.1 hypothetical protein [Sinorhizobium sp. 6-70]MDK1480315.1 hypothetical protein [Sinorhizobium sp. 6-117]